MDEISSIPWDRGASLMYHSSDWNFASAARSLLPQPGLENRLVVEQVISELIDARWARYDAPDFLQNWSNATPALNCL